MDQRLIINKKFSDYIKIKAICLLAIMGRKKEALIKLGNFKLDLCRRRQEGEDIKEQLVMVNNLNGMIYNNKGSILKKNHSYPKKKKN